MYVNHLCAAGTNINDYPMLKEVSSQREVNMKFYTSVHLLYLPDSSQLLTPAGFR